MKRRSDLDASAEVVPATAAELAPELERRRGLDEAHRGDELARRSSEARHERDLADVAETNRRAELERAEREEQARADAELARMYRTFRAAGERTRITSQMARSGEARALRLERLRVLNLKVLVPVLLGFAAWSTVGVHHGAARLTGVGAGEVSDPMWWALWLLEPVLIGAVVWVIIVRARLAASGGRIDTRAEGLAIACLGTSVLLNFSAAIPTHGVHGVGQALGVVGAMIAHGIAPAGAAMTAHLIGIVDESIADADPWTENGRPVPLLAEMDLTVPSSTPRTAPESASESVLEAGTLAIESPATLWPLPVGERDLLPIVVGPQASQASQDRRSGRDRDRRPTSKAPARPRPNKGVPVPPSARKRPAATPREQTDEQLRERLDALVASGRLAEDASVRQVQSALGVGFDRAKRVLALPAQETETETEESAPPGRVGLTVMSRRDEDQEQRRGVA
jgi:hypothetical protein